ncbi:ribosome small subunit-dependent GTPase A [Streptomyces albireticuli]|uniref:Small ribosomal subunit biogenesis GTPase RsgA n=1 Tax=Streptomyces albireticuli TaxID=1940 RepID=A0A2A2D157_9ACTN|nr:ribosome small subunit-dependent GTPase A [Streptomyces albireticuli]MCD9140662.1 ribosome small subunit-dependent GTPase A [Streptomyces albireticuli]MCD9161376.1 ribosome small subunit-dependent GTPase A [Streptomyces albireticuli]MCD9190566.1 ribosome small subunit-dependent GTPase A [Streptomyces albireticuli]PAU45149.1 ribosome small subunit-dependent GTPase A [Streptomyces albireticuli]
MSFPSTSFLSHPTASTPPHPLAAYGWDADWAAAFAPHAARGLTPGRVVRVDRGRCDLVVPDGDTVRTVHADTGLVTTGDPQRIMCTGDWAATDLAQGFVRTLLPRRTAFVRSTSSKRSEAQILAANVTHAVIAVSLAVELDLGRVERFLTLAWESGATPLVVLTKADLVDDPVVLGHLLDDTAVVAPGAQVLAVSSATGEGVDVLAAALAGGTAVILGQSGAGKSTLANAVVGVDVQDVHATRDSDGKGRHTTTTRNLLTMPGGGVLIDTPGLRGVGLWDADGGVARTFAEIDELARGCRFHDCAHTGEPGCAVLAALDSGDLPERRLDSYRKLIRENEWIAARTDARLRAEIRRDWKRKQAVGRHMAERKRGGAR